MNFEPQKFFIGVIDFFSVIMPGALLAFLLKDSLAPLLGPGIDRLQGAEAWAAFLFAGYLLGQLIFLLGSLLDDSYDRLRRLCEWGQLQRMVKGQPLAPVWKRRCAEFLFSSSSDAAVIQAGRIKVRALQPLAAERAINTFQWCKAVLSKEHPQGLMSVQRYEADSKFFRSFVVILIFLVPIYWVSAYRLDQLIFVLALLPALSYWRFVDQRFKATQLAYAYVLTLEGLKGQPKPTPLPRPDGLTHAGGVVYRLRQGVPQYLLVQASLERSQWILPKGHIELGEHPKETAVREVREETGVWARICAEVAEAEFCTPTETVRARLYRMEALEGGRATEERQIQWLALEDALKQATFPEARQAILSASRQLQELSPAPLPGAAAPAK